MTSTLRIIRKQEKVEYHIKRSVFIGVGAPAVSEHDAKDFIARTREEYNDATHVAWAYIVGSIEGYSDAGEPAGTAGPPILRMLKGEGVTHGVICVIRYFGGIKLGKRGLIDAYGHTAKLLLEKAGVVDATVGYVVEIIHSYNVKIDGVLRSFGIDTRKLTPRYEDRVRWKLTVKKDVYDALKERFDAMDGVKISILGETLVEV